MNTGMMWFDNDPKTSLQSKIEKAVEYYAKKYFRMPNLVLINPNSLSGEMPELGKITVRPYRPVLPGHLWIGIEEKN